MIRRKIQLSGKLTYIVSLPKKWVEKMGLRKGDEIIIYPQDDGTLILSPAIISDEIKKREITLDITGKPLDSESLERLLIAYYEAGYDTIRILNREVIPGKTRENIRKILRKLSGLEIIEERAREIILQSFLDVTQIKIEKTLERMEIILKSMMSDLIFAIEEKNKKVLRNLMYRDDELDKFYSLLSKQVSVALKSIQNAISDSISEILNISSYEITKNYIYGSEDLLMIDLIGPSVMGFISMFFAFIISGVFFLRERLQGTLERMLASPLMKTEIIFGYLIAFLIVATIQSTLVVLTIIFFSTRIISSLLFIYILVLLCTMGSVSLAIFISSFMKTELQVIQMIPIYMIHLKITFKNKESN